MRPYVLFLGVGWSVPQRSIRECRPVVTWPFVPLRSWSAACIGSQISPSGWDPLPPQAQPVSRNNTSASWESHHLAGPRSPVSTWATEWRGDCWAARRSEPALFPTRTPRCQRCESSAHGGRRPWNYTTTVCFPPASRARGLASFRNGRTTRRTHSSMIISFQLGLSFVFVRHRRLIWSCGAKEYMIPVLSYSHKGQGSRGPSQRYGMS